MKNCTLRLGHYSDSASCNDESDSQLYYAVKDLSYYSDNVPVFSNVNFRLTTSGVYVLLAPNNYIQTVLLAVLSGRLPATTGRFTLGVAAKGVSLHRKITVAAFPHVDGLDPTSSVYEVFSEQISWHLPWFGARKKISDAQLTSLMEPVFGDLHCPHPQNLIGDLDDKDLFLVKLALANITAQPIMIVGSVDQISDYHDRDLVVQRLGAISSNKIIITASRRSFSCTNPVDSVDSGNPGNPGNLWYHELPLATISTIPHTEQVICDHNDDDNSANGDHSDNSGAPDQLEPAVSIIVNTPETENNFSSETVQYPTQIPSSPSIPASLPSSPASHPDQSMKTLIYLSQEMLPAEILPAEILPEANFSHRNFSSIPPDQLADNISSSITHKNLANSCRSSHYEHDHIGQRVSHWLSRRDTSIKYHGSITSGDSDTSSVSSDTFQTSNNSIINDYVVKHR